MFTQTLLEKVARIGVNKPPSPVHQGGAYVPDMHKLREVPGRGAPHAACGYVPDVRRCQRSRRDAVCGMRRTAS